MEKSFQSEENALPLAIRGTEDSDKAFNTVCFKKYKKER